MTKHRQRRSEPPVAPPPPAPTPSVPQPAPTDIGPAKLLHKLAETGTGKAKLKAARDWLMANQSSNTDDFLAAMLTKGIFGEGTINKAQALRATERSHYGEGT